VRSTDKTKQIRKRLELWNSCRSRAGRRATRSGSRRRCSNNEHEQSLRKLEEVRRTLPKAVLSTRWVSEHRFLALSWWSEQCRESETVTFKGRRSRPPNSRVFRSNQVSRECNAVAEVQTCRHINILHSLSVAAVVLGVPMAWS
jgi:hypothetical protein